MSEIKTSIRTLRELCAKFNIHTLCALERALYIGDGLTQEELAEKTDQTKQCVGRWEVWMEINGLLLVTKTEGRKARNLTYTAAGEDFIKTLTTILCR